MSLAWAAIPRAVLAHAMDLTVRLTSEGYLRGELSYSDGSPAADNFVRVVDRTDLSMSELALQTGPLGSFRIAARIGHLYAITAEGEEGHTVTVETIAAYQPADGPAAADGDDGVPIYLIIGGLLLFSLLPARWLRRHVAGSTARGR